MKKLRHILTLSFFALMIPLAASAQLAAWEMRTLSELGQLDIDPETGVMTTTNRFQVRYSDTVLTADRGSVNRKTGESTADGRVRIERDDQVWVGEHIRYNFITRLLETEEFRTGQSPVFAHGESLRGDLSNRVYTARHAYITTDDVSEPVEKIRATYIKIIPGERFEAHNAVLYIGKVPVFYFPYYSRKLDARANRFTFIPGYRSRYGAYLLGGYTFFLNDQVDGMLHLDYRTQRGVGTGADANLHLDQWGEAAFQYYYTHDMTPNAGSPGLSIPADRQRLYFAYNATPFTNLNVKSRVSYESDERLLHDFFEGEYRRNPQPASFVEVNKLWPNFSLDVFAQPRVNDYLETVERLPEVKLSSFRQQLWSSPVFYESESSAGWYRHLFAVTNSPAIPDYSSFRGDTFHQLTMPWTFFGWLNVTPRAGGRFTYYDSPTATNTTSDSISRGVFNTGVEFSFKVSRLWPAAKSTLLDVDGIRHIVEPSVNYVFVPAPSKRPAELPQFDYELPSLRLLPIEFSDYNSVDSVDSDNTLRLGLRNKLQTKRDGQVDNLAWWDVYTDWRLQPQHGQETFADLFSDFAFKPRSWVTLESLTRWDMNDGRLNLARHHLSLQPNDRWSWGVGHWYLRDGFVDEGRSLISSTLFWRASENWALRAEHFYEIRGGRMEEQTYSIYRDLRSWTAAVTLRLRDSVGGLDDFAIAFTFSLKAAPRYGLGSDAVRAHPLLGN
jgi:LPS-assembly protein